MSRSSGFRFTEENRGTTFGSYIYLQVFATTIDVLVRSLVAGQRCLTHPASVYSSREVNNLPTYLHTAYMFHILRNMLRNLTTLNDMTGQSLDQDREIMALFQRTLGHPHALVDVAGPGRLGPDRMGQFLSPHYRWVDLVDHRVEQRIDKKSFSNFIAFGCRARLSTDGPP